jgi:putative redox protein
MKSAQITWINDKQFVGISGTGHGLVIDSAEGDGLEVGPGPMELLLLGALGCTGMDVISVLKKKRQPVTGLKLYATGEQAETTPRCFTRIHIEYVAYGDVEDAALERAIELSETKYCSAIATLSGKVEFSSSFRVEKNKDSVSAAAAA